MHWQEKYIPVGAGPAADQQQPALRQKKKNPAPGVSAAGRQYGQATGCRKVFFIFSGKTTGGVSR